MKTEHKTISVNQVAEQMQHDYASGWRAVCQVGSKILLRREWPDQGQDPNFCREE